MKRYSALLVAALLAASASPVLAQQKSSLSLGVDMSGMDKSVRPADDFYRYVNGAWDDRTEIPADQGRWGSFGVLRDKSAAAVREILETSAGRQNAPGSIEQKVGDFYKSFMDTATINKLGLAPLKPYIDGINAISSKDQLPAAYVKYGVAGARAPFGIFVGQDPKNSEINVVLISQGGLGLPDRDYYLRQDEKFASIRKAYTDYITQLFTLAGQSDPAGAAQRILALETKLAEKQWDRARSRDRNATYNKMQTSQLEDLAPALDLDASLTAMAGKPVAEVIVRQPDFLTAVDALMQSEPLQAWKDAMLFGLLHTYADELPAAFVDAKFNFSGKTLAGLQENEPRWKRGVTEVQTVLGDAVGKLYIDKHFSPTAKARMDELVRNLLAAFKAGIDELEWMSPATKVQAQEKLAKFKVKIAYPERWRDFSKLEVKPAELIGNLVRAREFQNAEQWARLGNPPERWRWGMTPQTVNASYNPANNEITFPAAILQPPFFNENADDAVNYGGIGAVIGHEISHGFDDQGRKSDGDGNLRDWWTAEDAKAFDERTKKLGAIYESYSPVEGMHINGQLTMGENIGDLSGLAVAYRAYRMSLNGKEAPVIDGFTGDQRFFLGWTQVWRDKARESFRRNQLLTDPHSPGNYRAFVPLTNIDAWYKAFDVKPGDKLYRAPEDRVKIW